jgi:preprotein translocase subunit SecF
MQIFTDVKIDWIGKTKYFLAISLLLLGIGAWAYFSQGGLRLGIDFKGGTLVYVRFDELPPIDQIRAALSAEGLGNATIQQSRDLARPTQNEVIIGLEMQSADGEEDADAALDAGKNAILTALERNFGRVVEGKRDINAADLDAVAEALARRDPLGAGPLGSVRYRELAERLLDYRDTVRGGLVTDLGQFRAVEGVNDAVIATLDEAYYTGRFAVRNSEIVGPRVGAQLRRQALLATLYALAGMLVYIALRFEWVYGAAAVLATVHDVLITLGFFVLFGYEMSLTVVAALLTLVGYSMNDTIVIFDRVRENLRLMRREPLAKVVNLSINQTLSRTVLTSGLTFMVVLALFLLGGEVLRAFSFTLVVGILVGTYSSVGIAAALVVGWGNWRGHGALVGSGGGKTLKPAEAPAGRR